MDNTCHKLVKIHHSGQLSANIVCGDKLAMNDNSVRAYDLFPTTFSLVGKHFPKSYLEIVDCNTC